jgi:hypothetical protein
VGPGDKPAAVHFVFPSEYELPFHIIAIDNQSSKVRQYSRNMRARINTSSTRTGKNIMAGSVQNESDFIVEGIANGRLPANFMNKDFPAA